MVRFQLVLISFLYLIFTLNCEAADLKPWFGVDCETEIRSTVLYQNYNSIAIPGRNLKRRENDAFLILSAAYPFKRYCGEFEVIAANTRHQRYRWDSFQLTARYQWLNELEGAPFSLVTGITVGQPYSLALHDISSFHHGRLEGEAHLAFGKKYGCPCSNAYLFRWWNVIGIGVGDKGSPWIRGEAACEYCYDDVHQFRGFVNTLWGMGKNDLYRHYFAGYGKIKHKSVDLGVRYAYTLGCWGTWSLSYARRVYAYDFPKDTNLVAFEYYYKFGSQPSSNY